MILLDGLDTSNSNLRETDRLNVPLVTVEPRYAETMRPVYPIGDPLAR